MLNACSPRTSETNRTFYQKQFTGADDIHNSVKSELVNLNFLVYSIKFIFNKRRACDKVVREFLRSSIQQH